MSSHIEKPAKAGGFSSLQSTFKQVLRSQKTRQNIKNLLRVNQTDGFDCPGCAWGDNKQGAFQFCENGAKAVNWEATKRRVDAAYRDREDWDRMATLNIARSGYFSSDRTIRGYMQDIWQVESLIR